MLVLGRPNLVLKFRCCDTFTVIKTRGHDFQRTTSFRHRMTLRFSSRGYATVQFRSIKRMLNYWFWSFERVPHTQTHPFVFYFLNSGTRIQKFINLLILSFNFHRNFINFIESSSMETVTFLINLIMYFGEFE